MSILTHADALLADVFQSKALELSACSRLIKTIDLTLLDEKAGADALNQLFRNALIHQVAAVCTYPEHLPQNWASNGTQKATVINFPNGCDSLEQSFLQLEKAEELQADEIDYVFPYQRYQGKEQASALLFCEKIIQKCKDKRLTVKIILETGTFNSIESIYQLSSEVLSLGCDYIKTSTGKSRQGASLSAAFAILSSLLDTKNTGGIKISGGIKTPEQAFAYMHLAEKMMNKPVSPDWFRIGSSGLLQELIKAEHQSQPHD